MSVNRYPDACNCGRWVPAGQGELRSRWSDGVHSVSVVCNVCLLAEEREVRRLRREHAQSLPEGRRWRARR